MNDEKCIELAEALGWEIKDNIFGIFVRLNETWVSIDDIRTGDGAEAVIERMRELGWEHNLRTELSGVRKSVFFRPGGYGILGKADNEPGAVLEAASFALGLAKPNEWAEEDDDAVN